MILKEEMKARSSQGSEGKSALFCKRDDMGAKDQDGKRPRRQKTRGKTRFFDLHDSQKLDAKYIEGVITRLQFKIWAKTANQKPRNTSESEAKLKQICISAGVFGT